MQPLIEETKKTAVTAITNCLSTDGQCRRRWSVLTAMDQADVKREREKEREREATRVSQAGHHRSTFKAVVPGVPGAQLNCQRENSSSS